MERGGVLGARKMTSWKGTKSLDCATGTWQAFDLGTEVILLTSLCASLQSIELVHKDAV